MEFVHYQRIPAKLEEIEAQRDWESIQAVRNGMGHGIKREGVVLRPPIEVIKNNGKRIIAKFKHDDFRERRTKNKELSAEKLKVLEEAQAIADEWVTPMRLTHVLDKYPDPTIKDTGKVINAMIEDVTREGEGEIVMSTAAKKAISKSTATLFKQWLRDHG